MNRKFIMNLLLISVLIISFSTVSANELINENQVHNLTELQNDIDCSNNTFTLQHNYSYQIGDSIINITRNNFKIDGNGYFIDGKYATGLFQVTGENITIINLNFINGNASENGGAIDFIEGSLSIENCNFTSNIAQKAGGGVLALGNVTISNCKFISNKAINGAGGGVRGGLNTRIVLYNNYFEDNTANVCGGAACGSYGNIIVDSCTFIKNKCIQYGGAICIAKTGTISKSVFIENEAILGGGAINRATDSRVVIKNCNLTNNSASLGGAIRIGANNVSIIENCILIGNNATNGGGINTGENSLNLISNMLYDYNIAKNGTIIFNSGLLYTINSKVNSVIGTPLFNEGTLLSNTLITVLNNQTIYVSSNNTILTAEIVCDNLKVNGGVLIFFVGKTPMVASWNGSAFITEYEIDFKDSVKVTADYENAINKDIKTATLKINSTQLTGSDLEKFYKGKENYNVLLTENDAPLTGKTVAITVCGKTYYKITDDKGIAKLNINLNPGVYLITAKYGNLAIINTITVKQTIYSSDIVKMYKNATQYLVLILDNAGNPIVNEEVAIDILGKTYYRTTDEKGIATLNINLNPGTYDIVATHPKDGSEVSNKVTVINNLISQDLIKYYKNGTQYKVRLLESDNKGIANETVSITVCGKTYYRNTDAEGYATLNINLNPGNYDIASSYNGISVSNKITVRSLLEGINLVKTYGTPDKYYCKVVDGTGLPAVNKTVSMSICGKIYYKVTDTEGIAYLNINLLPGKYVIQSSYEGLTEINMITVKSD